MKAEGPGRGRKVTSCVRNVLLSRRTRIGKRPLLGDFVEGEDPIASGRLRFLDRATAVTDAGAAHIVAEEDGCLSQAGKQISECIAGLGHENFPVNLAATAQGARHRSLSNDENHSLPQSIWAVV